MKVIYIITVILSAILLYRFLKRVFIIIKIRRIAESIFATNIKYSIFSRIFRIERKYDISFDCKGKRYNIALLMVHDKKTRYFFKDENTIERYVATLFFAKGTKNYSRHAEWHEKRKIKLPWKNLCHEDVNVLLFNHFPTELADANSRTSTLGNGDTVFKKILVYDVKHFIEYLKNLKKSDS